MSHSLQQQATAKPPPSTAKSIGLGETKNNSCKRCGLSGCDVTVQDCGCTLHARCCPLSEGKLVTVCPICRASSRALMLIPMNFDEIDNAQAQAARTELSAKRGKKRQNATVARLQPKKDEGVTSELRTGRWTTEETAYCDKLINHFDAGRLPLPQGIKLNDFLSNMLKSKPSRLTKKMKNAKLSMRQYRRVHGYIVDDRDAIEFSQLECEFFSSIRCDMERSEIRFHMQKEWRELFSSYCTSVGQKLEADSWLNSVEELDRRNSVLKDAARMARRKVMMGYALSQDAANPPNGVFIDPNATSHAPDDVRPEPSAPAPASATIGSNSETTNNSVSKYKRQRTGTGPCRRPLSSYSSPFVGRVVQYIERHRVPFEHVDAWVPSLVPTGGETGVKSNAGGKCRLCFAGCATSQMQVAPENTTGDASPAEPIPGQDEFDLMSFGVYSQKFSFDVGCGLPGRVYSSGNASWEQGIHNAPSNLFERCGGANQWGIRTVLGVPIASPNVGRIVVVFYSRFDRQRDDKLTLRIMEELTKLMPSPQWKLVVDVGLSEPSAAVEQSPVSTDRELLSAIDKYMPETNASQLAEFLPGFTSIRILLTEQTQNARDQQLLKIALDRYKAYKTEHRQSEMNAVWMTARDFMHVSQQLKAPQQLQPSPQPTSAPFGDASAPLAGLAASQAAAGVGATAARGLAQQSLTAQSAQGLASTASPATAAPAAQQNPAPVAQAVLSQINTSPGSTAAQALPNGSKALQSLVSSGAAGAQSAGAQNSAAATHAAPLAASHDFAGLQDLIAVNGPSPQANAAPAAATQRTISSGFAASLANEVPHINVPPMQNGHGMFPSVDQHEAKLPALQIAGKAPERATPAAATAANATVSTYAVPLVSAPFAASLANDLPQLAAAPISSSRQGHLPANAAPPAVSVAAGSAHAFLPNLAAAQQTTRMSQQLTAMAQHGAQMMQKVASAAQQGSFSVRQESAPFLQQQHFALQQAQVATQQLASAQGNLLPGASVATPGLGSIPGLDLNTFTDFSLSANQIAAILQSDAAVSNTGT